MALVVLVVVPAFAALSVQQGQAFSGEVVNYSTSKQVDSATIDWGDGQTSAGTVSQAQRAQTVSVSGSHTYHSPGQRTITVTSHNADGTTDTNTAEINVTPAPLTLVDVAPHASAGANAPINVARITDQDEKPASDYQATIAWPGATSAGTVGKDANGLYVQGTHLFPKSGSAPVHVSVTVADGRTVALDTTVIVDKSGDTTYKPRKLGAMTLPHKYVVGKKVTITQKVEGSNDGLLRAWNFGKSTPKAHRSLGAVQLTHSVASRGEGVSVTFAKKLPKVVHNTTVTADGDESVSSAKYDDEAVKLDCSTIEPSVQLNAYHESDDPITWTFDGSYSKLGYDSCNQKTAKDTKKYMWDFGDGMKATGKYATHVYAEANHGYDVTLTVIAGKKKAFATTYVPVFGLKCGDQHVNGFIVSSGCMKPIDFDGHLVYVTNKKLPLFLNGLVVTPGGDANRILVDFENEVFMPFPIWKGKTLDEGIYHNAYMQFKTIDNLGLTFGESFNAENFPTPDAQGVGRLLVNPVKDFKVNGVDYYDWIYVDLLPNGQAKASIDTPLPSPFAGASLPTDFNGQGPPGAEQSFTIDHLWYGPVEASNVTFTRHADGSIDAAGKVDIADIGDIDASFAFGSNYSLKSAHAEMHPDPPGIELSPFLFLTSLTASITINPFNLQGSGHFASPISIPDVGELYSLDACFNIVSADADDTVDHWCEANGQPTGTFTETVSSPRFHATGDVKVLGGNIDLAQGSVDANSQAFVIHGHSGDSIEWPEGLEIASYAVDFDAQANFDDGRFEASGGGQVCAFSDCQGGSVLVSNVGIAGCLPITLVDVDVPLLGHADVSVDMGGWAKWDFSDGGLVVESCDVHDSHHVAVFKRSLMQKLGQSPVFPAAAGAATSVKLANAKAQVIAVKGSGHSPKLVVKSPDGKRTYLDPGVSKTKGKKMVFLHSDQSTSGGQQLDGTATTYVVIGSPTPGNWSVGVQPGSSPVSAIDVAPATAAPKVTGTVEGSGEKRTLKYTTNLAKNEQATFSESGPGQIIASTKAHKGSTSFLPALGKKGTRAVYAVVTRNGVPVSRVKVDSYPAPAPRVLAKTDLALSMVKGRAKATWTPVPGATEYLLSVQLPDGRTLRYKPGKKTSYTLPLLAPGIKLAVTVRAVSARTVYGKRATKSLTVVPELRPSHL